jgi:putative phage-type endonuclease
VSATIDNPTRAEWLSKRRTGIGASDSPVVLGLSPFKSPFELWAEKTGNSPGEDEMGEPAEWGLRLERPIAEAFAERMGRGVELWPQNRLARHASIPWLVATPDAIQHWKERGEPGTLQIKTTSAFNAADWADGPPLFYQVQCQHELAVTGHTWGTLCVLIGGQKLRTFDYELNPKFIEALLPKLEAFWRSVEDETPPPVDGSLATARVLARLHPSDNGETVMLPHEALEWSEALAKAKEQIKAAEAVKTEMENRLKAAMGDATFGLLPDGSRWSWKSQDRAGYTVAPTTCRVLRKLK